MAATPSSQTKQLETIVFGAVKKARSRRSYDRKDIERLRARAGEFQEYLIAGMDRFCALAPDYTLAKSILGGDFITPEEIAAKRPVAYTNEQIEKLAVSLPDEETLRWLKASGYALMAAPPSAQSLLDIRNLNRLHFYSKEGGWYSEEGQKFAHNDKTSSGWIMIRKTPVPDSTRKTWAEQGRLLSSVEFVPNVAEAVWFITTFYEVRGVRLFENVYVRTSSIHSGGYRVNVGFFDAEGLSVGSSLFDDYRHALLGVSSARKQN